MIKRKRKENKAALIAVRAYTVVGNDTGESGDHTTKHHFPIGTRVVKDRDTQFGLCWRGKSPTYGEILQFVSPCHLI